MWTAIVRRVVARLRARWLGGELFCLDAGSACAVLRARPPADLPSADADIEILRQLCLAHREIQRDAAAFILAAPPAAPTGPGVRLDGHAAAYAAFRLSFCR